MREEHTIDIKRCSVAQHHKYAARVSGHDGTYIEFDFDSDELRQAIDGADTMCITLARRGEESDVTAVVTEGDSFPIFNLAGSIILNSKSKSYFIA